MNDVLDLSHQFIKNHQICGFFCCDDHDAIRVIGRLKTWNIEIPEEISIVSYGNTDIARYFTPPITSIDPHSREMAETTAHIIQQKLNGEDVSLYQYVIQPQILIRGT